MKAQCNCASCRARRAAQQRWVDKNRERKRATNARSIARLRATRRQELAQSIREVSDEELDRRAMKIL